MTIHGIPPASTPPEREETPSKIRSIISKAFLAIEEIFGNKTPPPRIDRPVVATTPPIDYRALYTEAMETPTQIDKAREAIKNDPPYLLFIARQRANLGASWEPRHLSSMPKDPIMAFDFFLRMGDLQGPLLITPEDIKLYVVLSSKLYHSIATSEEGFYAERKQSTSYQYAIYAPNLAQNMTNLANFCGVKGDFRGNKLEGNRPFISYKEINSSIPELTCLRKDEAAECQRAFERAGKFDIFSSETVEQIKAGAFITIPLGFVEKTEGHHVDLVFYNDEFVICNRGARAATDPVIARYTYDKSRLNPDVIKYLIYNSHLPMANSSLGIEHQHLYLYTILPKILGAQSIENPTIRKGSIIASFYTDPISLSIKDQKIGNCTKAGPVTAFKMMVYLKRLKEGLPERSAAWEAKIAGDELSTLLRVKMIERVENQMPMLTPALQREISPILANAKSRLSSKQRSIARKFVLGSFLPKDYQAFFSQALATPTHLKRARATADHHPLLLLIARQRKTLSPIIANYMELFFPSLPIFPDQCKDQFRQLGGFQNGGEDPLYIEIEDFKIFSAIVSEIEKYPEVLKKMGF